MAMKYYILQIDSKGQITLPKEVRKHMGLRKSSHLLLYPLNDALLVMKVNKNFHELVEKLNKTINNIKESEIDDLIQKVRMKKIGIREDEGHQKRAY